MPDYEIRVAGPIGPVVASIFPGFTTTAEPTCTVLSGTVADVDGLLAVMNLLRALGFSPFDTRDTDRHGSTPDQVLRHQGVSSNT